MASIKEIAADLDRWAAENGKGRCLTASDIARYMGVDRHSVSKLMQGVIHIGGANRYFYEDVAKKLFEGGAMQ